MPPTSPSTPLQCPRAPHWAPSYFARLAAGLETSLDDSPRWSAVGRTIDPDPTWARAAAARYERFRDLGTGA